MTAFAYSGKLDGRAGEGQVADGRISGNPFVAIEVRCLVDNGVHVGLGPWSGAATLEDETLARATVAAVVAHPRFTPALKGGDSGATEVV